MFVTNHYVGAIFSLCFLIFFNIVLDITDKTTPEWLWLKLLRVPKVFNINFSNKIGKIIPPPHQTIYNTSSVFCRGSNHTNRLCSFRNLCYEPNKKAFVFFSGPSSVRSGLPSDRFSPALTDFSSVEDHNTLYFNYVELPLSAADRFNSSFIDGHALVFKRFNPENLMHVFHDDLLPVYATLQELSFPGVFLVIADEWQRDPYSLLYENFLSKRPLYLQSLSKYHLYCFENIHVGLNKLPTWYQYGFKIPQGPLPKSAEDIAPVIFSFRNYFLQQFTPAPVTKEKHAILFTRKHNRRIQNEDEIVKAISESSSLPTEILSLEDNGVIEIISSLRNCPLSVGMHGSLLILSLFLEPGSVLVEAFPFGINSSHITPYRTLCQIIGVTYIPWENTIEANTYPHPEYPANLGGFEDLSFEERDRVRNSVVTPFLCCNDPVWLYRIYQDTTVDIDSFAKSLHSSLTSSPKVPIMLSGNELISPGEVENVSCAISGSSLVLEWNDPWNLEFVNASSVEYEVWLQDIETEDVRAFIVKKRRMVVSIKTARCYAWVRCYANGYVGPFGSNPTVCH